MATYNEIKNKLLDYAYENKRPITGEFEITGHCNFDCEMCYAKANSPALKKESWFNIFDMAYKNGILYALLTGGEIFTHPEFTEIYEYLYDLGVKITLYTNGSMINDKIIESLKNRPPEMVVITLYGYNEETYKSITKTSSFKDVDSAIDLLLKNNLNLVLRTIPLRKIYNHLDNLIDYAKSKKCHLGYFLYVSKVKKDFERLSPRELLDFEIRIKQAFKIKPSSHQAKCGAFRSGYFINHLGYMQACPMMDKPTMKVNNDLMKTFLTLQKHWIDLLEKSPCKNCDLKNSCMTCIARRHLEGNVFDCSTYLKEIAEAKMNA
ncbi:MAG: radical SAM protein [Candidatus Izemoplasmatales bacterium]